MRIVEWRREWGAVFKFVWSEETRRAYCLADNEKTITFYVCFCPEDPVTPERFNVLPWIDENVKGMQALKAWENLRSIVLA